MRNAHHEELVEVKTEDGLVHAGLLIQPANRPSHSVGVVWVHGAGVNFYHPTFLRIGRDLARRGVPFVTGNNRGHDFASPLGWVANEAIRGGEGWEDFEQSPKDVAAWVDFMAGFDLEGVALIGHSFGAPKVTYYQAQRQDARVLGLGIASTPMRQRVDPTLLSLAQRMAAEGRGDEPLPWRSIPSFTGFPTLSALTYLSRARIPDLYGLDRANSPLARISCPIFAFYGSEDIGGAAELEIMQRNATSAARVETAMFEGANHGYETYEPVVATALDRWVHGLEARDFVR